MISLCCDMHVHPARTAVVAWNKPLCGVHGTGLTALLYHHEHVLPYQYGLLSKHCAECSVSCSIND